MSIKRFGARYGGSLRAKFGNVEKRQKAFYECPSCKAMRVKRISLGIWQCRKCSTKLAGKAYSLSRQAVVLKEITPIEKESVAVQSSEMQEAEDTA
ncbi:MAG TPA: 50S ribosomal protein L37ae [Candidatus Nanoarchaeia archaeon]|nr:50S ribosomal protein L37ae [Candidatus Nanoarchaeia archaeon]